MRARNKTIARSTKAARQSAGRDGCVAQSEGVPKGTENSPDRAEHQSGSSFEAQTQAPYEPIFSAIAKKMCSMGATNADLAEAFQVSADSIVAWQAEYEEFCRACQEGEAAADTQVERSLFRRATGYAYEAEKIVTCHGRPTVMTHRVHVPADVSAGKWWFANRGDGQARVDLDQLRGEMRPDLLRELSEQLWGTAIRPKE